MTTKQRHVGRAILLAIIEAGKCRESSLEATAKVLEAFYPEDPPTSEEVPARHEGHECLRNQFAALAPETIPDWFQHKAPEKNIPLVPSIHESQMENEEALDAYNKKVQAHDKACDTWREANAAARYFQWRIYFADRLLATLNTTQ